MRHLLPSCVVLLAITLPRATDARPATRSATARAGTTASIERRARDHFSRGKELSDAGRFAEALSEFAAGHELSRRPLFLFNMGECARALHDARARSYYEGYLAADPSGAFVVTARTRLAELAPPAPGASITQASAAATSAPVKTDPRAVPLARPPTPVTRAASAPAPLPRVTRDPRDVATDSSPATSTMPETEPPSHWRRNAVLVGVGVAVLGGSIAIYAGTRGRECGPGCIDLTH